MNGRVSVVTNSHVICGNKGVPPEAKPANTEDLHWIIKDPDGRYRKVPMHSNSLTIDTPTNGKYRVSVEFWKKRPKFVEKWDVSNAAEIHVTDIPGTVTVAPGAAPPAP